MKFPFSNSLMDELAPLRELRSPHSTSAIRERVLERAASSALWGQLKDILAEVLMVGVAGVGVFLIGGPVAEHRSLHGTPESYETYQADRTDRSNQMATLSGANAVGVFHHKAHRAKAGAFPASNLAIKPIPLSNHTLIPQTFPSLPSLFLHPSSFIRHPSSLSLPSSPIWFASVSGGAIFSRLRILGERGEIGFEDGWKTIAFSYMSGDGSRDLRDAIAHHSGSTAILLSRERNQEFSMLLGAAVQAGPFELRAMAGPAYLSSSSVYFNPATGTTAAPVSLQGFGVAAEASAIYQLNSSFEIAINGTANYLPRQFTSGLFASLEYRFGP